MTRQPVALCERNATLATLLRSVLRARGYEVTLCSSLCEILAALDRDSSTTVVTDVWSDAKPGLLGLDIDGLRKLVERTDVVLTTAWLGQLHLVALDALEFAERLQVLPKPFHMDELVAAVEHASFKRVDG
jgi:DNA-binding NtrC family response regulator